jgi:hypothetical protein
MHYLTNRPASQTITKHFPCPEQAHHTSSSLVLPARRFKGALCSGFLFQLSLSPAEKVACAAQYKNLALTTAVNETVTLARVLPLSQVHREGQPIIFPVYRMGAGDAHAGEPQVARSAAGESQSELSIRCGLIGPPTFKGSFRGESGKSHGEK